MEKIILGIAIALAISGIATANIQELLHETQRVKQKGEVWKIVWWMPTEYWSIGLRDDPSYSAQQKEDFLKVIDEYTVFLLCSVSTDSSGGLKFAKYEDFSTNTILQVGGEIIPLLSTEELSSDAQHIFINMKPKVANMLGAMGQGVEFLVYPNKKDGTKIITPTNQGFFEYTAFGETEKWRLPLGSLLPSMYDEKTGEQFPGNYAYNPFTGNKLKAE